MGEMEELCDVIYVMQEGRVIHKGTAMQLAATVFEQKKYLVELYDADGRGAERLKRSFWHRIRRSGFEEKEGELVITGKRICPTGLPIFVPEMGC